MEFYEEGNVIGKPVRDGSRSTYVATCSPQYQAGGAQLCTLEVAMSHSMGRIESGLERDARQWRSSSG
jgi:hypothetical protein